MPWRKTLMIEIKGSVLSDSIHAVKERSGEQIYNNIIDQLDEQSKKIFEQNILATSWYPLDSFVKFLELDIQLTAYGDKKQLIRRSEAVVEKQLTGIYKLFVKLGSPEFVLNRISIIHKSYFKGVSIDIQMEGANTAILRYSGFEKQHELIGLVIIGFFKKALEISGANGVITKYSTAIEDGKGYCDLVVTWTGKEHF